MTEATPAPASAGIAKLATALAKAQGAFRAIVKNREVEIYSERKNTKYRFKYADLEELIDATREHLAVNGLSIVQLIAGTQLRTVLLHESGEELVSEMPLGAAGGDDIKTFGAKISYLRRYAYQSLLCLAADDDLDEDGNEAGQVTTSKAPPKAPAQPPAKPAYPDDQFKANMPLWEKRIAGGKAKHADIIATVESKYTLTGEQKKQINDIKSAPAAAPAAEEAKQ